MPVTFEEATFYAREMEKLAKSISGHKKVPISAVRNASVMLDTGLDLCEEEVVLETRMQLAKRAKLAVSMLLAAHALIGDFIQDSGFLSYLDLPDIQTPARESEYDQCSGI